MAQRSPFSAPVDPEKVLRKNRKKCIYCRKWYRINQSEAKFEGIGRAGKGVGDGYQSMCKRCKTTRQHENQQSNPTRRVKHHFNTRMEAQLGPLRPTGFTAEMETYLGYTIKSLVRQLSAQCRDDYGINLIIISALRGELAD